MNTILLQKILDILTEGLAHVGNFFKDLFISDPQDGQVIGYDGNTCKWKNVDLTELSFDITHTAGPADSITITDAAANMPVKSLVCDIVPKETGTGTKSPSNPYVISGTDSIVITHTYGDNVTETKTDNLSDTVYSGSIDIISGKGTNTFSQLIDLGDLTWNIDGSGYAQAANIPNIKTTETQYVLSGIICNKLVTDTQANVYAKTNDNTISGATTNQIRVYISAMAGLTAQQVKEYLAGYKVIYPLATPTAINETPTPINTQGGSETFAVDANDMELEYYTATAGDIKSLVCITDDITSEITKNTTDFSDILLKVSQNNKVVSVEIYSATTAAAVNDTFLSNLPKPAMNCKVLLVNTTLGEDGTILGTLKTSGELEIATSGAKSFSGLITYVAK